MISDIFEGACKIQSGCCVNVSLRPTVARVSEVDTLVGINHQVVGRIEAFPCKSIC